MQILADPYKSKRSNHVFPVTLEGLYLVDHLKVPKGGMVLDLCTGSGIVALFAARKAGRIIATDIDPRALAMAHFNAAINNMDKKIEFRQGNLFQPIEGMLFDLIAAHPPFELTGDILKNADKYLHPGGSLQVMTCIPDEDLCLLDSLKERFRKVKVMHPYSRVKNKVIEYSNGDRSSKDTGDTYEHMDYSFIHASAKKPNS